MTTKQEENDFAKRDQLILPLLVSLGLVLMLSGGYFFLQSITTHPPVPSDYIAKHFTQLTFSPANKLPYLLTDEGDLLIPNDEEGVWIAQQIEGDIQVNRMLVDANRDIWLATDHGLHVHQNDEWHTIDATPVKDLLPMDADVIKIGVDDKPMGMVYGSLIDIPLPDMTLDNVIPLGDQSHVALSGGSIYYPESVDLWLPLDIPGDVQHIRKDGTGHMLVETTEGIFRWWWEDRTLELIAPNVENGTLLDITLFEHQIFAITDHEFLRFADNEWQSVTLSNTHQTFITQLKAHGDTLWALDEQNEDLWLTEDGVNWEQLPIVIQEQQAG